MALPPIITNSPLFKVLSGTQASQTKDLSKEKIANAANDPRDVVELSDAALQRLSELKANNFKDQDARVAAQDVRENLANNPDTTLGLSEEIGT